MLERLASAGFISPGRAPGAEADASAETIDPDAEPIEEPPAESAGGDGAGWDRYWRWMHAQLDAHLDAAEVEDLGAPAIHDYRALVLGWDEGAATLAHSRSVGVRDRGAFDARTFEGLHDGFARLG